MERPPEDATAPAGAPATAEAVPAPPCRPWGAWATAGLGVVIFGGHTIAQLVAAALYLALIAVLRPGADVKTLAMALPTDAVHLVFAIVVAAPVGIGLTLGAAALRRGCAIREYLALRGVPVRTLARWLGLTLAMVAVLDTLSFLLGRPIVPPWVAAVHERASPPALAALWLALAVPTPAFEEIFFRGFLLEGWRASRLGAAGAVALSSLVFAMVHLQYDAYGVLQVFAIGLLLAVARLRTGSVVLSAALHGLLNTVATLEALIGVR